jgi:predicted RNA-binding Zn ribbon-like protein
MTRHAAQPTPSQLVARALCLDFANTVAWHASARPQERLATYDDLLAWCRRVGVLDPDRAVGLAHEARRRPRAARAALGRARHLREVIYRIVVDVVRGSPPETADLAAFNRVLSTSRRRSRVVSARGALAWTWVLDDRALDAMLWPIAESAAELPTSEGRRRIGRCADDRGCGWLFLDTSRNRSRRWCAMGDCGNRAKARRHYQRTHGRRASGGPGGHRP